jgi:radical SAM protein (TIGR01212 family)
LTRYPFIFIFNLQRLRNAYTGRGTGFLKRYRDYNSYLREIFGARVQKISLDAGLGCPNRDGTLSRRGCIFCDSRGSGTGAMIHHGLSISRQVERGMEFCKRRYKARKFIAYFQSFTNTWAPPPRLKALYDEALGYPEIVGLSVATRPDCVNREIMALLSSYQQNYLVWIEYGLQSSHDRTLLRINRGHDVACFERGMEMARNYKLNVCAHLILGLPGETREMMRETARYIAALPLQGIKLHLLYVVKGTPLASLYQRGEYRCLDREEYVDLVVDFIEILPPEMVIHRLTGDPLSSELVAPSWAREKTVNLNLIRAKLEERQTWQGKNHRPFTAGKSTAMTL